MNNVDSTYQALVREVLNYGTYRKSRAGDTMSLFARSMRFSLKEGLPILTTKKIFTKGIIQELLWFLKGDTNIKYLVDNGVHIWDDDAYRWYITVLNTNNEISTDNIPIKTKEDFIQDVKDGVQMFIKNKKNEYFNYKCGDLGDVYGKSWRNFGVNGVDQIQNIINTLMTDPTNRRLLCVAYNPDTLDDVALPPCHIMFQFYARELTNFERFDWLCDNSNGEYDEYKNIANDFLDSKNVPKYELSCSFYCRSQDLFLGTPFNITSYSILTHMIAQCVNMTVGELIWNGGDVHLYTNHVEAARELILRNPNKYSLPKLRLNKNITNINDFKYEDIEIVGYSSYPPIKAPLSVGEPT